MTITLTPEHERFIRKKVASGHYESANQVVNDALRLLEAHDSTREERFQDLKREIAAGIDAADRGELLEGEQVMASLKKRHEIRVNAEVGRTNQEKRQA